MVEIWSEKNVCSKQRRFPVDWKTSVAECYKGSLVIMEVALFLCNSFPLLTHCENYAICRCNYVRTCNSYIL